MQGDTGFVDLMKSEIATRSAEMQNNPDQVIDLSRLWLDLSADIPEPQPLLKQGDTNICTRGNFSCITGPAKSKKTALISAMVGAFLCDDDFLGLSGVEDAGIVLYIDTEQGLPHVQRVIRRIHRIAGFDPAKNNPRLRVLCLREQEPVRRKEAVSQAIERIAPRLCVIDGVGDLMRDTNDNREAVEIATLLLQLTTRCDCHIITALHTNPGGDKARGHIGSEIIRKAETVIKVQKEGNGGDASTVTPAFCRDKEFQEFAFRFGADGLPELTDVPVITQKTIESENLFAEILPCPKSLTNSHLVRAVMSKGGISESTAHRRIKAAKEAGLLIVDESGYYRLKQKPIEKSETLPF